ncbi:MBL fold metallo-hydrolase [Altererythrobacter lutimaris]|uniref:MBL fold metallo-hydrolase n=1 Tax=Altererythrobacter lutimaris TaxID=2743979 RepID=A0A850H3Y0_9SPHN|nr:MBL fold metallo-hydrolase [Altererythrobacter lutimaris]NVE93867.1 MBL fold metallo-hydrolase [Altererythrobacter lutimaris]
MFAKTLIVAASSVMLTGCVAVAAEDGEPGKPGLPADQQAFLDACEPWDDWDKPAPPFKVYGNTYYVGTCGIASILIKGKYYDTLIDSGTDEGAKVVLDNIRKLGFDPKDISYIYISHEHYDHVGGIARIEEATGATIEASEAASEVLMSGVTAANDPQAGSDHPAFTPVKSVVLIFKDTTFRFKGYDGITPIHTPGHSPGATSWTWPSCEGDVCKTFVYADSLSPVSADDYRFSDHPEYLAEYRAGLDRLAGLDCDILLAPHPSHARLLRHLEERTLLTMEAPCAQYAEGKRQDIARRLEREAGANQ